MTTAIVAGVVVLVLVVVFGFDRSRLSKRVGETESERDEHKRRADLYEEALAIMVAPNPTLDELERMSDIAARAAAGGGGLSQDEQGAVDRLLRSRSTSKAGEGAGG